MKNTMKLISVFTLPLLSCNSIAQTVSTTASTLDGAEKNIAKQAERMDMSYEIIGANFKNRIYMTGKLTSNKSE